MALIKCPECGRQISDRAARCPNCGITMEDIQQELRRLSTDELSNDECVHNSEPQQEGCQDVLLTTDKTVEVTSRKGKKWLCYVIPAAIILIIAGAIFLPRSFTHIRVSKGDNNRSSILSDTIPLLTIKGDADFSKWIDPEEERLNKEIADRERTNMFAVINDDVSEFEFRMSGLIGDDRCELWNDGGTDEDGTRYDFQIKFERYGDNYLWFTQVEDFDKETGRLIMSVSTIYKIKIGKFIGYLHGEVGKATYKGKFISNDCSVVLKLGFFDDGMYWGAY